MMRYAVATILIISFIIVGVFGFAISSISSDMHGMNDGCIAKALNGNICPRDVLEYISYHISAFNKLLSAVATQANEPLLALTLLALCLFIAVPGSIAFSFRPKPVFLRTKDRDLIKFKNRQRFTEWISLLENSPGF